MERVTTLLHSQEYREHVQKIYDKERQRSFCKHDFHHFLDVARLSWIFLLQDGIEYLKDVVYAAALLHDIGRWKEYNGEGCHAQLSAELALPLLINAGYSPQERKIIVDAISEHRQQEEDFFSTPLSTALRKADKYSRLCFKCSSQVQCRKFDDMPQNKQLFF